MKKILFLAATLSFGIAYGQHNDFFDAEKYLKNKNKEQRKFIPAPFSKPETKEQAKLNTGELPNATYSHTLPNGNKVYLLPQDNMPCVVPDLSQFTTPVVKPDIPAYTIPNPAYPPTDNKMVFHFKEEQLKKLLEERKVTK